MIDRNQTSTLYIQSLQQFHVACFVLSIYKRTECIIMIRDCLIAFWRIHIKALLTNKKLCSYKFIKNSTPQICIYFHSILYVWHLCIFYSTITFTLLFFNKMKMCNCVYLYYIFDTAYAYLPCIIYVCLYEIFT